MGAVLREKQKDMAKRPAEGSVPPPPKRASLAAMSPLDIGPACGEEDLNVKVLQVRWRVKHNTEDF